MLQPHEETKKSTDLQPGDIIFQISSTFEVSASEDIDDKIMPVHAWIHGGSDAEVLHSSNGETIKAVTRHTFKQCRFDGYVLMLRCQNEKLRDLIIQIAKLWAPKLAKEKVTQIDALKIKTNNPLKANLWNLVEIPMTPYALNRVMTKNISPELEAQINIFRAVRAALRSGLFNKSTEPLSKIRGVSCNQFLGFTLQSALVAFFLDEKLEDLRPIVTQITKFGLKNCIEKNQKLLEQFSAQFTQLISKVESSEIKLVEAMTAISFPVKGNEIERTMPFWRSLSFFSQVKGMISFDDLPKIEHLAAPPKTTLLTQPDAEEHEEQTDEQNIIEDGDNLLFGIENSEEAAVFADESKEGDEELHAVWDEDNLLADSDNISDDKAGLADSSSLFQNHNVTLFSKVRDDFELSSTPKKPAAAIPRSKSDSAISLTRK